MMQLAYTSRATPRLRRGDLDRILAASRRNNPALGVTGLLLYLRGEFMQLLEGDEAGVLSIYEKVARDPRHDQCRVVRKSQVAERDFPDWSMGFEDLSTTTGYRPDGLSDFLERPFSGSFYRENQSAARRLLSMFRLARQQS